MPFLNPIVLLVLFVFSWSIYKITQIGKRESFLPPGPPTVPLLGNLHIFPKSKIYLRLTEWARQYGDVYSLKLGSKTAIVITSVSAIREIMDKNSASTSDRPRSHMIDLITGGKNLALAPYQSSEDSDWKKLRRGAHEVLSPQACVRHWPIQQAEATQLMHELLTSPQDFFTSVRRCSSSLIMSVVYGKRAPRFSTPEVTSFFRAQELWDKTLEPGAHPPVDLIPILQKLPERFAKWKAACKGVRDYQRKLYFGLLAQVEGRMAKGEANGCFLETVCERADEWKLDRELVGYLGGVLVTGASDTVASFLLTLVLALVANPEVQKKAQKEIDDLIGLDRAPTLDDVESLPYLQAVIKETHRFRPIAPLAVPHATSADIMYRGYRIPAGTTIFVNNWGIFHDNDLYENESVYDPDRHMEATCDPHGGPVQDWRDDLPFGSGRRICPGIHLAKNSLAITTLNFLWAFNFGKAKDPETGADIEPDVWDYAKPRFLSTPNPFKCTITPRSPQHVEIIEREFAEAANIFSLFEHELADEDRKFVTDQRKAHSY